MAQSLCTIGLWSLWPISGLISSPLRCLEEVGSRNLPCVDAAFVDLRALHNVLDDGSRSQFAGLAKGYVVVGRQLQVFHKHHAETYVNAELRGLEGVARAIGPLEVLAADVEAELRTCKEVDAGLQRGRCWPCCPVPVRSAR